LSPYPLTLPVICCFPAIVWVPWLQAFPLLHHTFFFSYLRAPTPCFAAWCFLWSSSLFSSFPGPLVRLFSTLAFLPFVLTCSFETLSERSPALKSTRILGNGSFQAILPPPPRPFLFPPGSQLTGYTLRLCPLTCADPCYPRWTWNSLPIVKFRRQVFDDFDALWLTKNCLNPSPVGSPSLIHAPFSEFPLLTTVEAPHPLVASVLSWRRIPHRRCFGLVLPTQRGGLPIRPYRHASLPRFGSGGAPTGSRNPLSFKFHWMSPFLRPAVLFLSCVCDYT